ncbi:MULTISPECIES: YobI family P-loop NTPase [unclassified Arthrobacter]|uniref:YobI family P-loop NTPase n=1 Tax=unclassified Arthrobacter TaxID=235627 RepID=UPI00048A21BC|nr:MULTISPECIES: hypothetical protein [unclassified Arthrobacter]
MNRETFADGTLALRSLAPEFEDQHKLYVDLLVDAIEKMPAVRNIALTGPYGTGKSSILGEIARKYPKRVVELSFSTVGKVPVKEPGNEPAGAPAADAAKTADATPTNRIEKEIVKQILYKEDPSRTRGSRFRRITRFQWGRQVVFGLTVGLLALGVLFLTGLDKPFMTIAGADTALLWLAHGMLFLLLSGSVVVIRWLTHNRVFLDKFTAGPATVSLSSQSSSYFDQYLDEIVYYFEVSKRDIVVFEDIDRFNDVHIFEALKALNTLLNGAKQVKRRRPLKFIYALRDSVFEKIGESSGDEGQADEAREEIERANRTKFFDLVVPVVPFITHRNARDLMADDMKGTGVSRDLINLAARHVADMRLIHNMRNEYDVFASKLLSSTEDKRLSGLDADRLFSMIVYKNVHMADFEKIRFGDSQLDMLHGEWRKLVRENIAHETSTARDAASRLETLNAIAARSEQLGERLEQLAQVLGRRHPNGEARATVLMGGVVVDSAGIRDGSTWTRLITERGPVGIQFNPGYPAYSVPFEQLSSFLGIEIVPEAWNEADRTELNRIKDDAIQRTDFLRHNTWQELAARPEFTLPARSNEGETFRGISKRLLGSELARQLVANGYINDYFALYVSVYYGKHLRLDAQNYIVQHIDKGQADPVYVLLGDDVDAIIAEKGEGVLRDPSMYNCSVMDHLLENKPKLVKHLFGQMGAWGEAEKAFGSEYLAHGQQRRKFIEGLVPLVPAIFEWLVAEEGELTVVLIDEALRNWSPGLTYNLGGAVRSYFEDHAAEIASLTADKKQDDAAKAMALIAESEAALPSLRALSPAALEVAADLSCYRITAENLRFLAGGQDIALDRLRETAENVYRHVLEELDQYLAVVHDGDRTVSHPEAFAQIIQDVHAAQIDQDLLAAVIQGAAEDCFVPDLKTVPAAAWDALAGDHRTTATFENVTACIDNLGEVGPGLAILLRKDVAIAAVDGTDGSKRIALAITLLASREALSDPELRVGLASSLVDPGLHVPAENIQPESGELIGHLLERGVIADGPSAFSNALMLDWSTRESAIEGSEHFADYMSPAILPAADLPSLFASARISPNVKAAVLESLAEYAMGDDGTGVRAAARYAEQDQDIQLDYPQIQLATRSGVEDNTLVRLMAHSPALTEPEMRDLLRGMGGDYPLIADPGRERPLLPDDSAHLTILRRLKDAGVVSSYPQEGGRRRVHRFHS